MSYNSNNRGSYYGLRYLSNPANAAANANASGANGTNGSQSNTNSNSHTSSYSSYTAPGNSDRTIRGPANANASSSAPGGGSSYKKYGSNPNPHQDDGPGSKSSYSSNGAQTQGMSRKSDRDFHSGYRGSRYDQKYSKYNQTQQQGSSYVSGNTNGNRPSSNHGNSGNSNSNGDGSGLSYGGYSRSHYLRNNLSTSLSSSSQANKVPVSRKYDRYDPSKKSSASSNAPSTGFDRAGNSTRDFRDERRNGPSFYNADANPNASHVPSSTNHNAGSSYTPLYSRSYSYRDYRRDGVDSGEPPARDHRDRDSYRDTYRDRDNSRYRDHDKDRDTSIYRDRERNRDRDRDRGRTERYHRTSSYQGLAGGKTPPRHFSQERKGSASQGHQSSSSTPPHTLTYDNKHSYNSPTDDLRHRKERALSLDSPEQLKRGLSRMTSRRDSSETDDRHSYTSKSAGSSRRSSTHVSITDPKLLHLFDEDYQPSSYRPQENHPSEDEKRERKTSVENEDEMLINSTDTNEENKSKTQAESSAASEGSENSNVNIKKKSFGVFMKEKQLKAAAATQEDQNSESSTRNQSEEEDSTSKGVDNTQAEKQIPKETHISSAEQGSIDSSTLSPVGDMSMDDPFYLALDTLREEEESKEAIGKKSSEPSRSVDDMEASDMNIDPPSPNESNSDVPKASEDEKLRSDSDNGENSDPDNSDSDGDADNDSEAETLPSTSPVKPSKGRRLIRKKEYDESREKLKAEALKQSEETIVELPVFESSKNQSLSKSNSRHPFKPYKIKRDSGGRSMLQRACKKGNLEEIQSYVERGASVNESDFCGFTCLHEAALEGHADVVRYLLEKGADVNAQASDVGAFETPLIDAAENKHTEVVRILIEHNADPTIFNIDGFSALTKIQNDHDDEEGYEEIVELLERAIASKKEKSGVSKQYIVSDGARLTAAKKTGKRNLSGSGIEDPTDTYFSELIKKKKIYKRTAEGDKEFTADFVTTGHQLAHYPDLVIIAARNGHTELIDIVLGLNFDPYDIDHENSIGMTALLASVGRGHVETVKSLLSKGADPLKVRKQDGLSVLEIAKSSAHYLEEEVRMILKAIGNEDGDGETDIGIKVEDGKNEREKTADEVQDKQVHTELESENVSQSDIAKNSEEEEEEEDDDADEDEEEEEAVEDDKTNQKQTKTKIEESNVAKMVAEKRKRKYILEDDDFSDEDETSRPRKATKPETDTKVDESPTGDNIQRSSSNATPPPVQKDAVSPAAGTPLLMHLRRSSLGNESSHHDDMDVYSGDEKLRTEDESDIGTSREHTPGAISRSTLSPSPMFVKAQEELKAKNAEEIRLYQEKKEDKRKQKKVMFLKLEKEKEIKRKQEEKMKIEQEKKLEALKREEEAKLALMAKEKSKQIEKERNELRHNYIIGQYPKGLQRARFDRTELAETEVQRYLPLYLYSIRDQLYILDMHLALLTACPISDIEPLYNKESGIAVDGAMKAKLWKLYFSMIGSENPALCYLTSEFIDGHNKFQKLVLTLIPFTDTINEFIRTHCPSNQSRILDPHNFNTVSLEDICPLTTTEDAKKKPVDLNDTDIIFDTAVIKSRFVPPKLKHRKDSVRASYSVGTPLW